MKLRDAATMALCSLRGAWVRTMLTILGLSVGVAAVLTVLTLGSAGEIRVEQEIANLGVDKVWITPRESRFLLHAADAGAVQKATGAPACASAYTAAPVRLHEESAMAQVAGFDHSMEAVHAPNVLEGRTFRTAEFGQGSPVCLIDEVLDESLGGDCLGQWLMIGNRRLRVVGKVETMAPQTHAAGSGMVILPLATYFDTFGEGVSEIVVSVQTGQQTEAVAKMALSLLQPEQGYRVDTLEEEIGAAREIVRIFVMVLFSVAMVCMLTGAIGVTNVLLISVRERKNEIGLLKAIGGTKMQLALLFLLEAVIYTCLGEMLGVILGTLLIRLFAEWVGLNAVLQMRTIAPVLISATMLGLCAGLAPAFKAAQMEPVEALKCE